MELKFILSLGFSQVDFEEKWNVIGIFLRAKTFNISNGSCRSGIFQHNKNKKLFIVVGNEIVFIGLLEKSGFEKHVELCTTVISYDRELYQKITKMTVREYTKI